MILVIKPILFAFLRSDSVKKLVVDLLEAYVARTDNKLDDQALAIVKTKLFDS
tara:strand:+ start:420 stop:578 length:159 start_codon:yes stop_codon:yes gene_type:complete